MRHFQFFVISFEECFFFFVDRVSTCQHHSVLSCQRLLHTHAAPVFRSQTKCNKTPRLLNFALRIMMKLTFLWARSLLFSPMGNEESSISAPPKYFIFIFILCLRVHLFLPIDC